MRSWLTFAIYLIFVSVAHAQTVTWTNDRGGSGSGAIIGSNWTITTLPLKVGINNITVTYTNASLLTSQDSIIITYAPAFPGNTLAGSWGFNEGSGIYANDSSGNTNTGTLINTATRVQGIHDKGISLNGVDQYVTVPDANSLDFTQSFTFSAWVTIPAVHIDYRPVMMKSWMIGLFASVNEYCTPAGAAMIWFNTNGDLGPEYWACSTGPLPTNTPVHIAGTYDGSNLKFYINGVLIATTPAGGYIEPSDQPFLIGKTPHVTGASYFDGVISSPRVYNYALPLAGKLNAKPGDACNYAESLPKGLPSIVGDMNCPIIQGAPPTTILIGPTGVKVGANAVIKFGSTPSP